MPHVNLGSDAFGIRSSFEYRPETAEDPGRYATNAQSIVNEGYLAILTEPACRGLST
jgi:hypothetical protein